MLNDFLNFVKKNTHTQTSTHIDIDTKSREYVSENKHNSKFARAVIWNYKKKKKKRTYYTLYVYDKSYSTKQNRVDMTLTGAKFGDGFMDFLHFYWFIVKTNTEIYAIHLYVYRKFEYIYPIFMDIDARCSRNRDQKQARERESSKRNAFATHINFIFTRFVWINFSIWC